MGGTGVRSSNAGTYSRLELAIWTFIAIDILTSSSLDLRVLASRATTACLAALPTGWLVIVVVTRSAWSACAVSSGCAVINAATANRAQSPCSACGVIVCISLKQPGSAVSAYARKKTTRILRHKLASSAVGGGVTGGLAGKYLILTTWASCACAVRNGAACYGLVFAVVACLPRSAHTVTGGRGRSGLVLATGARGQRCAFAVDADRGRRRLPMGGGTGWSDGGADRAVVGGTIGRARNTGGALPVGGGAAVNGLALASGTGGLSGACHITRGGLEIVSGTGGAGAVARGSGRRSQALAGDAVISDIAAERTVVGRAKGRAQSTGAASAVGSSATRGGLASTCDAAAPRDTLLVAGGGLKRATRARGALAVGCSGTCHVAERSSRAVATDSGADCTVIVIVKCLARLTGGALAVCNGAARGGLAIALGAVGHGGACAGFGATIHADGAGFAHAIGRGIRAVCSYFPAVHNVVDRHTRSDALVPADTWYWAAVQVVCPSHARSLLVVAAVFSCWPVPHTFVAVHRSPLTVGLKVACAAHSPHTRSDVDVPCVVLP